MALCRTVGILLNKKPWGRQLDRCASAVYERRSKCKLTCIPGSWNRDSGKLLNVMSCGVTNGRNDSQGKGVNGMARIIEFHVPEGFNSARKYAPPQERGTLIIFPTNLTKSAPGASGLKTVMTQPMNTLSMELALFIWPSQEWSSVNEVRRSSHE